MNAADFAIGVIVLTPNDDLVTIVYLCGGVVTISSCCAFLPRRCRPCDRYHD